MGKNIEEFLESKKCFKLICGAGNKNLDEITKLCALYAAAGCRFFDVNASVEAIQAAKKGIKFAGKEEDCFICVSVGTKNDPHLSKCKIDSEKCVSCGSCEKVCLQKAISQGDFSCLINEKKCVGCAKCIEICPVQAIERYSKEISFSEILPPLIKEGVDCIEYHIITDNQEEIMQGWKTITDLYNGVLSISIDRSKLGNDGVIEKLLKMKEGCKNILIIQAEGKPMTGGKDDFNTTLQAVAMTDTIIKADITPYVIISGGTNSHTKELAKLCEVDYTGIAVGTYARKIVKEFTERDDFLKNKDIFERALNVVKDLVNIG